MKIALVYIRHFSDRKHTEFTDTAGFIALMLEAFKEHQCTLITNHAGTDFSAAAKVYPLPEKHILPWNRQVQLKSALQKTGPQLVIHLNKVHVVLKHTANVLIFTNIGAPFEEYISRKKFIKVASELNTIICFFEWQQELLLKYQVQSTKLLPILNVTTTPDNNELPGETLLQQYSIRRGYFLYLTYDPEYDATIDVLKAFAQFKKRQKTNRQLVICSLIPFSKELEKRISSYKYRADVIMPQLHTPNTTIHNIIKESYAIITFNNNRFSFQAILTAMAYKISVITLRNNIAADILREGAIYINSTIAADLGDALMLVYKDENLRNVKIEAAVRQLDSFSEKNTMAQLQAIIETTQVAI